MAETIKEFLVGLGYKVDGSSEAKFKSSVETVTKQVAQLSVVLTGVAVATTAAVTKIARGFDDLYYMSQRANASASNIKAVGYAVSQLGGSYQGATDSIEAFGQKLRSNPGFGSLVRSLGVATEQNGKLRDTVEITKDLAKALASKPYYVQLQYMEALGLDERTYRALQSGDLSRYIEEYRKKQEALGVNQEQAARVGRDLSNAWRQLGATVSTLGEKLMVDLAPHIERIIKRFDDFLVANADKISAFFDKLADFVGKCADAFIRLVEKGDGPIVDMFAKIEKSIDSLTAALTAFAAFLVGTWLVRILGAFTAVSAGWAAMLLRLGVNPLTITGGVLATQQGYGPLAEHFREQGKQAGATDPDVAQTVGTAKAAQNAWRWVKRKLGFEKEASASTGVSRYGSGGPRSRLTGPQAAEMKQGIEQSARDLGISAEDLATVISYETGGTMHPWQKGPTTKWGQHRGLIQWGEPQRRKYGVNENSTITEQMQAVTRYLRDAGVRPGHGILDVYSAINAGSVGRYNASDAAAGGAPGTVADKVQTMGPHKGALSKLGRMAANAAGIPYLPFSGINAGSMAAVQSNAALIGSGITPLSPPANSNSTNIDMTQKTEITVLGGSDPAATGAAVAAEQKGVNGGLLRNMQGAVR